jgi:nucleoside 2-deoxyribosyltransferase
MAALTIVGGVYGERCIQPAWDAVYGSAGRAAEAVQDLVAGTVELVTYVASDAFRTVQDLANRSGATLISHSSSAFISFDYFHPLATPTIHPHPSLIAAEAPITVKGDVVLRYGMMEGDAVVDANMAVYDPQSAFDPQKFSTNGSKANRLAIVLNRAEASAMTGIADPTAAAKAVMHSEGAEVIVLKRGSHGATVITAGGEHPIPAYETDRVWKVGSGDVFSATFAALWACHGLTPERAADLASRATANYVNSRHLPVPDVATLDRLEFKPIKPGSGTIYLAGPFFDISQRWLVEESLSMLTGLGATVFSPVHAVGPGPAHYVAPKDIAGLEKSDVVFAILNGLDTGTIFEVGYAVKKEIPVVALAQNVKDEDLKMIVGSNCTITDDFASALYRAVWRLP